MVLIFRAMKWPRVNFTMIKLNRKLFLWSIEEISEYQLFLQDLYMFNQSELAYETQPPTKKIKEKPSKCVHHLFFSNCIEGNYIPFNFPSDRSKSLYCPDNSKSCFTSLEVYLHQRELFHYIT